MIVLDSESTSLNVQTGALISLGAVDFERPERQFYQECQAFSGAFIDPESLAVNGFSKTQLLDTNKPTLRQLLTDFLAWLTEGGDWIIAGQNVHFDLALLEASLARCQITTKLPYRLVDLHAVAYAFWRSHGWAIPLENGASRLKADAIYPCIGLPPEPRPHNALTGAKMEAEAFSRLIFGKVLLPEFSPHSFSLNPPQ